MKTAGRKSGFSLVEVVIAIGIFSFALVAILGLFGSSMTGVKRLTDRDALVAFGDAVAANLGKLTRTELASVPSGTNVGGRPTFYAYAPHNQPASDADQDVAVFAWTNTPPTASDVKGSRVFRTRIFRAYRDASNEYSFASTNISFPVRAVVDVLSPGQDNESPTMTWSFHRVLIPGQ